MLFIELFCQNNNGFKSILNKYIYFTKLYLIINIYFTYLSLCVKDDFNI